ncbi:MAG: hypothetical protein HY326_05165, partial [Chloroflexi bacterium]|nr:hypothetical protein [Chloroflexota bacterium]
MAGEELSQVLFRQAAQAMLSQHGWGLLNEAHLASRASEMIPAGTTLTKGLAERACQQVYATALYSACLDPSRQELAYRELHTYLYRIARHQRPHLAEDAAQE